MRSAECHVRLNRSGARLAPKAALAESVCAGADERSSVAFPVEATLGICYIPGEGGQGDQLAHRETPSVLRPASDGRMDMRSTLRQLSGLRGPGQVRQVVTYSLSPSHAGCDWMCRASFRNGSSHDQRSDSSPRLDAVRTACRQWPQRSNPVRVG